MGVVVVAEVGMMDELWSLGDLKEEGGEENGGSTSDSWAGKYGCSLSAEGWGLPSSTRFTQTSAQVAPCGIDMNRL